MKKHIPPFFAGFAAEVLLLALGTSALAASGKVSYNFSNVALNGETKITASSTWARSPTAGSWRRSGSPPLSPRSARTPSRAVKG